MESNKILEELLKEIKLLNENLMKINTVIDEYKFAKEGTDVLSSFIKSLSKDKK